MSEAKSTLSVERLREVLDYDAATGVFRWKIELGTRTRVGAEAGFICDQGYRTIRIDRSNYTAGRLAWAYVHGCWPKLFVDHMNGDRADNRLTNLREASKSVNVQNQRRAMKTNQSGFLGVTLRPSTATKRKGSRAGFSASIHVGGKNIYLGNFSTAEAAHEAYVAAKRSFHEGCTL